MAVTLRFRPVRFGSSDRPGDVYYLVESTDGRVHFRDFEIAWPLDVPLDAATVDDLPPPYRTSELNAHLLPVHEATGRTVAEAHERLTTVVEGLATRSASRGAVTRADPTSTSGRARSA